MDRGIGYDRCDGCGRETEVHDNGGHMHGPAENPDWSIFHCNRQAGGCGDVWAKTTERGAEHNISRGSRPGVPTPERAVGRRSFLMPELPWKKREAVPNG